MTDLVKNMREAAAGFTAQDKLDALKVVDEQIAMTRVALDQALDSLNGASNDEAKAHFGGEADKLAGYITELEDVRVLLVK